MARLPEAEAFEREYPGSSHLASSALRELEVVGAMIEARIAKVSRGHGLSHAALNALAVIEGAGGPIAAGEVGARMHITSGTMTSVLDTLERNGHIQRLADPDDRRRVLVDITPAAQEVLDRVLPEVQQLAMVLMGTLHDKGLHALVDALGVVRAGIANLPDELPTPAKRRTPAHLRRS